AGPVLVPGESEARHERSGAVSEPGLRPEGQRRRGALGPQGPLPPLRDGFHLRGDEAWGGASRRPADYHAHGKGHRGIGRVPRAFAIRGPNRWQPEGWSTARPRPALPGGEVPGERPDRR